MADSYDLVYLQPGFDLNTLTVPRLRSILVAHDIQYASSAKKVELIATIQDELLPQARKLLREQARVRRTSRGITDVPGSQKGTMDDDESNDKERMPPPPAPKTPRGRKSKTNLAEEPAPTVKSTSRRSKTASTRRSRTPGSVERKPEPGPEPEPVAVPTPARRTRKSTLGPTPVAQTPSVRVQNAKRQHRSLEADGSPFTQDNPFQSPTTEAPPAPHSRKSLGASSTRKSTSRRRIGEAKREEIEIPISHLSTGADGIDTTEEFTEDAQQELSRDIISDRSIAKARKKDLVKHNKKPSSTSAKAAPWVVLTTVLSAVAAWYRQEKVAVGYCGVGQPQWSLAESDNVPAWVSNNFQPECEPCPQHAVCFPNMQVECEHNFILQQRPLSLNGLIPIRPTCEPDSEKERRVKAVGDRAIEELRQRRADYECGTHTSATEEQISSIVVSPVKLAVSEEALKETISKQRRKNMSPAEFEDLWNSALGDIKARDEVEVTRDKSGRTFFASSSFAKLPLGCSLRRSFFRTLAAYRIALFVIVLMAGGGTYSWQRLVAFNTAKSQTPSLVARTLDRLATQAALHEDGRASEAFISVGQLRDDVLRDVFSRSERERTWGRVKKIVEANSNVRAATREGGKTGEWSRVWEWIGPTNFVPGLEGRRSGGMIESSPAVDISGVNTPQTKMEDSSGHEMRKWDEGRAVY